MELRHIRYFVRAAELLHFTQAAESLYVSQPTLSTHIHQLEEEVGLPLFDRIGRNVRLTAAGKIFLEYAKRALLDLEKAREEISDVKGLVSGTLRIGSLLLFGQEMLPSWLSSFHARYPQIRMEAKTGTSDMIEAELQAGNIDLALSFVPSSADGIEGEKLFHEHLNLVVADNHPLADRKQLSLAELDTIPLAVISRRHAARKKFDVLLNQKNVSLNIIVEIDDLQALLKIASAGKLATLLGNVAAANYPKIKLIPIIDAPEIDFGILWSTNAHLGPAAKAFVEHVKRESGKPEPLVSKPVGR